MSIASALLPERDGKDLGFLGTIKTSYRHYYRSNHTSRLAMSHCGLISPKDALIMRDDLPFCHHCEMIEQMRDERQE